MQDGTGATANGQRRPGRPYDSWRAPTPFWSGRLYKEAVESHWRRLTIKDAWERLKWKGGEKRDYKCLRRPVRPCDSGSAPTIFKTGRLWNGDICDPMEANDHEESLQTEDKERKSRCHSKGSVSPRVTIRQLEGTDDILEREAF